MPNANALPHRNTCRPALVWAVVCLALLGMLWPPLWQAAAVSLEPLVALLQALAAWPGAVLALPAAPLWAAGGAVLGGLCLALRWPWRLRVLGLPLLVPALCWQPARPAIGQFDLIAADVGQGNAVLVRTAGHALLYDAGPRFGLHSNAGERVLVPLLRSLGVRLDALMVSHSDSDHAGGAPAVLAAQPGAALWGVAVEGTTAAPRPCTAGQRWEWDGVVFELLHPPSQQDARRPNAQSCVLRIRSAQGVAAVLAGDIEQPQEQALLARGAPLAATLLLVPHHGSKTSSGSAFIDAVGPRWALVQAGYRNRYGHPAPEVVQRYRVAGTEVVDSSACGAARWDSARPQQMQCERTLQRRYWQHAGGR